MRSHVRAEVLKVVSTWALLGMTLGAAAVVALGTVSTVSAVGAAATHGPLADQQFFLIAATNLACFAVVLGAKTFTDEFRHGTVIPTVLLGRSRSATVTAKALVVAVAAAVLAAVSVSAMIGLSTALGWTGGDLTTGTRDWQALAGLTASTAAWGAFGVAIGGLLRHPVAAVVTGLVWVLLVENLGAALLGDNGRWLPGQAGYALAGVRTTADHLAAEPAAATLLAYLVALLATASAALARRDV